jgi:hypothetical protein
MAGDHVLVDKCVHHAVFVDVTNSSSQTVLIGKRIALVLFRLAESPTLSTPEVLLHSVPDQVYRVVCQQFQEGKHYNHSETLGLCSIATEDYVVCHRAKTCHINLSLVHSCLEQLEARESVIIEVWFKKNNSNRS